jgi:WhiB family transcriptional regulator, redox-sensing transcriptional regulator
VRKPWEFEDPLCAEVGVEIFFARDSDDKQYVAHNTTYREAKEICRKCDHQIECAEWGIKNEEFGVWGGLSPQDMKAMRSRRRIPITPKINIIR